MYEFSKEPLGIARQLDHGLKLTRSIYRSTLGVIFMFMIVGVLSAIATPVGLGTEMDVELGDYFFVTMAVFMVLNLFLYFLLSVRCVYAAYNMGDLADALAFSVKNILPFFGMMICNILCLLVGSILLLIPGLILMISFSVSTFCLVLEGTGPIESLKRSHTLIWGNWVRTATVLTVAGLLTMVFYLLAGLIAGLVVVSLDESQMILATNIVSAVLAPFVQPLLIAFGLVIYNDVRLRKEGGDLELAIENL